MKNELSREILGNIDGVSCFLFYVLSAAALACFAYGIWRRARIWTQGRRGTGRLSFTFAARQLFVDVFQQRKVRRQRPLAGLAHTALFWGFTLLFVGTLLVAVEHYAAVLLGRPHTSPVFHKGLYYAVFELTLDVAGLLLIGGCCFFLRRRLAGASSMAHRGSDYVVLVSLIFIGVSGYFVEGARIIREETALPGLSPVGWCAAKGMIAVGVTPATVSKVHYGLWWLHAVSALALVAAIPYCRLLHIIAGVANIASRNPALGMLHPISIEQVEAEGKVGVEHISDFTMQQLIALDACVSCGRCEDACPAHEAGKPLSPRDLVQDLRQHAESGNAPTGANGSVAGDVISEETLWSCTTCSACVDVCPLHVAPLEFITDLRRHVVGEGKLRGAPATSLQKMQRSGNPWGLPAADRFQWSEGLDVPTVRDNPDFEILYWVGCSASYDRRVQKVARAVVKLLQRANVSFACLGPEERCTGESARRMGDEFLFQELAQQNVETLRQHNVRRIVTHCPHCLNSLRNDYPQMGSSFYVVHHSEFLAQLLTEGRLVVDPLSASGDTVTYHDPCYLARVHGHVDEPRQVLSAVSVDGALPIVEPPRSGCDTACCGAGGGRMWFDDAVGERVGTERIRELLTTETKTIAVSCPFCMTMVGDGVKSMDAPVEVRDIAELLADAVEG